MKDTKTLKKYQQAMIDAYYDTRMHQTLDPLYEAFQQWKRGDLDHSDLADLIHKVHRENQRIYTFFTQSRDMLVRMIQMDSDWFSAWSRDNPPPPGVEM